MPRVCVLTDNTAQFPTPSFPGRELVNVVSLDVQPKLPLQQGPPAEPGKFKPIHLPRVAKNGSLPDVIPPSVETLRKAFAHLNTKYDEIIAIFLSSQLSAVYRHAIKAVDSPNRKKTVEIIDSQTVSVGLGILVQLAAKAAAEGMPAVEIKRMILGVRPHVYSVFCVQGLAYLHKMGMLVHAQAIVGEMLDVIPFLALEGGSLVPLQKIRNTRHLIESFYEFVCEFQSLKHIAILQGVPPFEQESRSLRERIHTDYADTTLSEHTINTPLASIFGPASFGLFIWEHSEYDMDASHLG